MGGVNRWPSRVGHLWKNSWTALNPTMSTDDRSSHITEDEGGSMIEDVVAQWHAYLRGELAGGLDELLDDEVVFYSPIVFTPQRGKQLTSLYLQAAAQTFPGDAA